MDAQQIAAAMRIPLDRATRWAEPLTAAMQAFDIDTPARQAAFLAQIGHESAGLSTLAENLNYSAQALAKTWARFSRTGRRGGAPTDQAIALARKPEAIANVVYANRGGNGDEASGDGWRYRGRGPIQTTFLDGYRRAQAWLPAAAGIDIVANPDLLATSEYAGAIASAGFWHDEGLNELADQGHYAVISSLINTGTRTRPAHGMDDRLARWDVAKGVLDVA